MFTRSCSSICVHIDARLRQTASQSHLFAHCGAPVFCVHPAHFLIKSSDKIREGNLWLLRGSLSPSTPVIWHIPLRTGLSPPERRNMPVTEAPAPGPRPGRATMRGLLIAPAARLHHASAPLLPPDYSSPLVGCGICTRHLTAMLNRLIDLEQGQ